MFVLSAARSVRAQRYRWLTVASLLSVIACSQSSDVYIGDGVARSGDPRAIIEVVEAVLDSTMPHVRVARWTEGSDVSVDRQSRQAMRFAETPHLVGVVGHAGSRASLLAAAVYNAREIVQIAPNATNRRMREAGAWTFTLVPDDSTEGAFIADHIQRIAPTGNVSLFFLGDEFGIGLRDGLRNGLARHKRTIGDETLLPGTSCTDDQKPLFEILTRAAIKRSNPTVAVLALSSHSASCIVPHIVAIDPTIRIIAADGVDERAPEIRNLGAQNIAKVDFVAFWNPDSATSAKARMFIDKSREILGRDPSTSEALIFDSFLVLAQAVHEVGSNRRAIRRWIEQLGKSHPPFEGVTGAIDFSGGQARRLHIIPGATVVQSLHAGVRQ